jgi:hypothetical protein
MAEEAVKSAAFGERAAKLNGHLRARCGDESQHLAS